MQAAHAAAAPGHPATLRQLVRAMHLGVPLALWVMLFTVGRYDAGLKAFLAHAVSAVACILMLAVVSSRYAPGNQGYLRYVSFALPWAAFFELAVAFVVARGPTAHASADDLHMASVMVQAGVLAVAPYWVARRVRISAAAVPWGIVSAVLFAAALGAPGEVRERNLGLHLTDLGTLVLLGIALAGLVRRRRAFEARVFALLAGGIAATTAAVLIYALTHAPEQDLVGDIARILGLWLFYLATARSLLAVPSEGPVNYRALFDSSVIGVSMTRFNGEFIAVNQAYADMLGYASPDALMREVPNAAALYADPSVRPGIVDELQRTGVLRDVEIRARRRDGALRWFQGDMATVKNRDGTVLGFQSAFFDVTEARAAREREKAEATRLRRLIEVLPVGVWLADAGGNIVMGNEAGRRVWAGARYVGIEQFGEYKGWWPDGRAIAPDEWPLARALTHGETRLDDEIEIQCFDGTRKTIRNSAAPIRGEAGELLGAVVVNEDLTPLKRHAEELAFQERALRLTNERFEIVSQATNDAVWDWDLVANTLWWNHGYHALFGHAPERTSAGPESWYDFIHPEDKARVVNSVHAVIDGPGHAWSGEYRFRRADGSYAHILDRGYVVRDEAGRAVRMTGAMMDISERKNAEAKRAKVSRLYASLGAINELVSRAQSASELLEGACRIAVASGDFAFALVRLVREGSAQADLAARAGQVHPHSLDRPIDLSDGGSERRSLVAEAYFSGRPAIASDADISTRTLFGQLSLHAGVRAMGAYPLLRQGACVGALVMASPHANAFDGEMGTLLERVAASVSHGLEMLEKGESLRRFRLALDQSAELVGLVDRETMLYIDANGAMCRALGYSRDELLRMGPDQLIGISREELERSYDGLIAGAVESVHLRGRYRCKDGSTIPFEATRRVVRSGERAVIVSIGRDIRERLAAEEKLARSSEEFRALAENAPDAILRFDAALRCVYVNGAVVRSTGRTPESLIGRTPSEAGFPTELAEVFTQMARLTLETGETQATDFHFDGPRGARDYHARFAPERGPDGRPASVLVISRDITDRKHAERAIAESEARLRGIVEASAEPLLLVDPDGTTLFANPAAANLFGRPISVLEGAPLGLPLADGRPADVHIVLPGGGVRPAEMQFAATQLEGRNVLVVSMHDLSERKRFEEHIQHLATHDRLTGLPNRALLGDRVDQAITHARRSGTSLALLFVDLDHFKLVNDSFGHASGDALLVEIGERLRNTVRDGDTVARLGGDEFVILLTDLKRAGDTAVVAQKVADALVQPVLVEQREVRVAASIGISLFPDDGDSLDSLLQSADSAMYRAKDAGRNGFHYYSAEMGEEARARVETEAGLRRALESDELRLHYQPQVDLSTGRICSVEALMRWEHPQRGMVSPAAFIPVAEDSGLIVPMGQWALRTACREAAGWAAAGHGDVRVSVNLSARQFWRGSVTEAVRTALAESGLPASRLEVEITESVVARDLRQVMLSLEQLRRMGVTVAIDDFGTGYSSLAYLRSLPIQKLKIDKSFIQNIPADPEATALVGEIIRLAHVLSLEVVAEGVETDEQARFLREAGCEAMQGFLFARPLPPADCVSLLRSGRRFLADPKRS